MKRILIALLFSICFIGAKAQHDHHGDVSDKPGYSFMILEGISSASDAAQMDSLLLSLKDMVLFSKTDPVSKVVQIRVADPRIVYQSIYDFLVGKGYKPTKEFNTIE
ncbi:MAG: hypothetical protein AB1458_12330 [Bacteroidota bacterium]